MLGIKEVRVSLGKGDGIDSCGSFELSHDDITVSVINSAVLEDCVISAK